MALVLCTGTDTSILEARRLILESAGHNVVTVSDEKALHAACKEHCFDVAVVGQAVNQKMKRRIAALIRSHCPDAKVLELYEPDEGRAVDDADSWMQTPTDVPKDLPERVDELVKQGKQKKRGA